MSESLRITIVGGGMAGPLLACLLADDGHDVHMLERRSDPRLGGHGGGRSINLALSVRGLEALERIGLREQVLQAVVPMQARLVHDEQGRLVRQPYSRIPGEAINSVSRGGLNCMLLDAAESRESVRLVFEATCSRVDVDSASVAYVAADGSIHDLEGDLVVGADGAGSIVRAAMHAASHVDDGTDFIDSGYKELTIPALEDGGCAMASDALHIWPRRRFMMIALPNADGSFTCTCFWPLEGDASFAGVDTPEAIEAFFTKHFPDAVPLMPTLVDDYLANPVGQLGTVRCSCYHHGHSTVLVGDAAHAIVPFFGQGMNAAFQDCLRLADRLRDCPDASAALKAYSHTQCPDGHAIADLSLRNFIEMRDKTASPVFRFLQRMRKRLNQLFPGFYAPVYNLVSFTTIPYARIVTRARSRSWFLVGMLLLSGILLILLFLWLIGTM